MRLSLTSFVISFFLLGSTSALQCYQCGLYTDGIGSFTPCLKEEQLQELVDCKPKENFCIKFASKGLVVRQCASQCVPTDPILTNIGETQLFCCQEDGCNMGTTITCSASFVTLLLFCLVVWWFFF